ncbi:ABC transporter permease [Kribbella speibonae]|uniref:ABC transporter permease n=1 Tax=Kribbella speibonae TaxID=1572660 RepID=A0A4R0IVI2_9ACTN|nr:ABC transporter permease [Kribbella speibonae]TCC27615.1 ABC transporter permease [Kribbella speibonae]TCC35518.1 ABC transporter permease [Kribbella speibonae]
MSETTPDAVPAAAPKPQVIEAPADRTRRLRVGGVMVVFALIGLALAAFTKGGKATFQLVSGDLENNLLGVPAQPVAIVLGILGVGAAVAYVLRQVPQRYAGWLAAVLGVAFIGAFLCWAAAGKTFPLANQFQGTLNFATPLILGALAGVLCERAGVINIAIEGQFLVGAFTAALVSSTTNSATAALIAAAASGVVMAALLAVFSIKYLVNQVVLGVVLVVFATGITGFLFDQFMQPDAEKLNTPNVLSAVKIPGLADIPFIGPILFNQTILVYLTYLAVAVVTFVLFQTRWGLRIRAVGEHPKAADTVGIKVKRIRYSAVLTAGVLAGLGGAFFTVGYAGSFAKEMTAGNGFIALAALIMGRWHPIGATVAALFFGFATQLQSQLQIIQTPIPGELLLMAPYLATIIAVAGLVGRVRAPKADGEPYVTE